VVLVILIWNIYENIVNTKYTKNWKNSSHLERSVKKKSVTLSDTKWAKYFPIISFNSFFKRFLIYFFNIFLFEIKKFLNLKKFLLHFFLNILFFNFFIFKLFFNIFSLKIYEKKDFSIRTRRAPVNAKPNWNCQCRF